MTFGRKGRLARLSFRTIYIPTACMKGEADDADVGQAGCAPLLAGVRGHHGRPGLLAAGDGDSAVRDSAPPAQPHGLGHALRDGHRARQRAVPAARAHRRRSRRPHAQARRDGGVRPRTRRGASRLPGALRVHAARPPHRRRADGRLRGAGHLPALRAVLGSARGGARAPGAGRRGDQPDEHAHGHRRACARRARLRVLWAGAHRGGLGGVLRGGGRSGGCPTSLPRARRGPSPRSETTSRRPCVSCARVP